MAEEVTTVAGLAQRCEPPRPRTFGTSPVGEGRELAWAEFGHPDGDVVLWFHGTPGACLQVPPTLPDVALARGFRVIAVERPGTGRSTDHRYRRIVDFGPDIEALVDHLQVDRFAAVGLSGGGPYTLSVARHLPERVVTATLLGGLGPVRGNDAVLSYTRLLRLFAPPLEVLRSPVGAMMTPLLRVAKPIADPAYSVYANLLGFADRPVLSEPEFRTMFLHDILNAGNLRAMAHDMALFARHWGFHLHEVEPPVTVWHGLSDTIVPASHGHHQAARVQRGELRVRPGAGHFAGFSEVVDVLDRLREVWADQTAEPRTV